MVDLEIAVGILLVSASLLFWCGWCCGQKTPIAQWSSVLALAATLVWVLFVQGRLFLANWFPMSNIIVLSNWLPLTTAFLAGVVQNCSDIPHWRREIIILCLLATGWLTVAWTIIPSSDVTPMRRYINGICVQSVPNSCSACSCVTLLDHYGIMSDESEMAKLCLTSGRGTQLLGIYRGLKIKTEGTAFDVQIVQGDFDQLLAGNRFPVLVPLKHDLSVFGNLGGSRTRPWSWLMNSLFRVDHCVILYGPSDSQTMVVGDPASVLHNPIRRPLGDVRRDWIGVAFQIVPRETRQTACLQVGCRNFHADGRPRG